MSEKKSISSLRVVYREGDSGVITFLREDEDVSVYTERTLESFQIDYPGCKVYKDLDEVMPMIEKAENEKYIKPFSEITEEEWWEMYECLPPLRTIRSDDGLFFAFLMSEYWTSNITGHYFRIQDRYFSAQRRDTDNPGDMYQEIMKQFFIKQD